jgi:Fur family transcriptional regulator, ferric uptake regulator
VKNENDFHFSTTQAVASAGDMLAMIVAAGYSNTEARKAVCQAVCEAAGQASPMDLLALGRSHHPELGLVTVYRTLDILLSLGFIRKLHTEEGCHTYAAVGHDHGHHIMCTRCQSVIEFEGCDIKSVVAAVEQQTGFKVSGHWLEMFGLCPQCRASAEAMTTAGQ